MEATRAIDLRRRIKKNDKERQASKEHQIEGLGHVVDIMEGKALKVIGLDILDIATVVVAENDIGDTGTLGGQNFLADTSYGSNAATESDFARHSIVGTDRALGESGDHSHEDSDTGRRAILRSSTLGDMDMKVRLIDNMLVDRQLFGIRFDVLESEGGGLLHNIAEVARERERAFALGEASLDEEDFAADLSPGQAGDNADERAVATSVAVVDREAEKFLEFGGQDCLSERLVVSLFDSTATDDFGDRLIELTDTALAGIIVDNVGKERRRELKVGAFEAMLFELVRDEMAASNLDFFLEDIA